MQKVTHLVKRGPYSYALPLSKSELEALNIDPYNDDIVIDLNISDFEHKLTIQSKKEHDYNESHSYLSQMFDKFFAAHPEIKDREAYIKQVYDDELKHNQEYEKIDNKIKKTFESALTDQLDEYLEQNLNNNEPNNFSIESLTMHMPIKMKDELVSNHYTKWLQDFDQDNVNQLVIEHLIQLINHSFNNKYQARLYNQTTISIRKI